MDKTREVLYRFEIEGLPSDLVFHETYRVHPDVQEYEVRDVMRKLVEEYRHIVGQKEFDAVKKWSLVSLFFDDPENEFEYEPLCVMDFEETYFGWGEG